MSVPSYVQSELNKATTQQEVIQVLVSSGISLKEGIQLTTSTPCYTIGPDNLWVGAIYGAAEGTTTLIYTEK